jgi:hypothetical protein
MSHGMQGSAVGEAGWLLYCQGLCISAVLGTVGDKNFGKRKFAGICTVVI